MAKRKLDKETRKAIRDAQKMIKNVIKADGNEAETRRRVERFFDTLMGYDVFKHVSREYSIGKAGINTTEYCDFAIQLDQGDNANPIILVELKRANMNLTKKHLKQSASYAIDLGCEWVILTNGKEWRLYHISFTQPPSTKELDSWDLLDDDPAKIAEKFEMIGYKNVRKGGLDDLWQKSNVLKPHNLLNVIVSSDSLKLIRRELKKSTDVTVSPEEIVGAIRRLLNETALSEMANIKISLPEPKKRRRKKAKPADDKPVEVALEVKHDVHIVPETGLDETLQQKEEF